MRSNNNRHEPANFTYARVQVEVGGELQFEVLSDSWKLITPCCVPEMNKGSGEGGKVICLRGTWKCVLPHAINIKVKGAWEGYVTRFVGSI